MKKNTPTLKKGLAQMLKGGVIMDVVNAEQARIAEDAGAVVESVTHFNNPEKLAQISENLGEAMVGIEIDVLEVKLADRGW